MKIRLTDADQRKLEAQSEDEDVNLEKECEDEDVNLMAKT